MRRILLIAYFFPPLGGGGVQRSLKFARYLPEHGWEPVVLTVGGSGYWIQDQSLLREVPAETEVLRTFSPDGPYLTSRLGRLRGRNGDAGTARAAGRTSALRRVAQFVMLPDVYRPWKPFALRAARRALAERPVDAILSTASPETAHLVGRELARETGAPWVADFRDPWTRRIAYDPPTPLHHLWHLRTERDILTEPDRVVVTADETRVDFVDRIPGLDPDRVAVIPNGFDRDDFPAGPRAPGWDRFRLHYVGQLTAGRSIAPLLRVIDAFLAAEPAARAVTEVRCVGPREIENDEEVRRAGLDDVVRFEPPVPHAEAVRILLDAHVILLVEHLGERGGLIAQGKLYECLRAGRPLLAVVPPGAVDRLIRAHEAGLPTDGSDPGPGVDFLRRAFAAWSRRELLTTPPPASLARYERRTLTAELARLLDGLVTREA